jgi:hypothetical protein
MTPDEAKLMALEAANDIRNMALEEAARVVDIGADEREKDGDEEGSEVIRDIAAAIRELKK